MKLLLHTCCAPCLIYPIKRLKKQGFKVTPFFYNPNIFPAAEYQKRRMVLVEYSGKDDIEIFYPEFIASEFLDAVKENLEKPQRCLACWSLRLGRAAQFAKENGFAAFSTTLLVSPYQDQEALKNIGLRIAAEQKVDFYYEDFRPGFKKAHQEAKAKGIYCQNYCGCVYSISR